MKEGRVLLNYVTYDKNIHLGKKIDHRLREFYRFLDYWTDSTWQVVDKSLFTKFLQWNDSKFWKNRWDKSFREIGNKYLANREVVFNKLDTTTPDIRKQGYRTREYTTRREANIGSIELLHPRKAAKRAMDTIPWHTYTFETKLVVLENILKLAGKSGEGFLRNTHAVESIHNVNSFLAQVSGHRDKETLGVCQTLRSIMSGPNISPESLRSLIASKSRLEDYQDARERRRSFDGNVFNLKKHFLLGSRSLLLLSLDLFWTRPVSGVMWILVFQK